MEFVEFLYVFYLSHDGYVGCCRADFVTELASDVRVMVKFVLEIGAQGKRVFDPNTSQTSCDYI